MPDTEQCFPIFPRTQAAMMHHRPLPTVDSQDEEDDHPLQSNGSGGALSFDDLQFTSSIDRTVQQDVPIDPFRAVSNASSAALAKSQADAHIDQAEAMFSATSRQGNQGNMRQGDNGVISYLRNSAAGQIFKDSSHPLAAVFHLLFKSLALFAYIFGGWFAGSSNFVTVTVICIILLSFDFWVVKNVTGRLLVGLRWWNMVNDDGTSRWIFESAERQYSNKFDNTVFWMVTYVTPVVWGVLFIFGILKLELGWLLVVAVALALNCSNVYGYWKCSSDQKVRFQEMVQQGAQMGATAAIKNNMMGTIMNLTRGQQAPPATQRNATGNFT